MSDYFNKMGYYVPRTSTGSLPMVLYAKSSSEIRSIQPTCNSIAYVANGDPLCYVTLSSATGGLVYAYNNACYYQCSADKLVIREFAPTTSTYTKILMGGQKSTDLNNCIKSFTSGTNGDCGTSTSASKLPAYFTIDAKTLAAKYKTLTWRFIVQIDHTNLTQAQCDSLDVQMRYGFSSDAASVFGSKCHYSSVFPYATKYRSINNKNAVVLQEGVYTFVDPSKYLNNMLLSVPFIRWYIYPGTAQDLKNKQIKITGIRIGFSLT